MLEHVAIMAAIRVHAMEFPLYLLHIYPHLTSLRPVFQIAVLKKDSCFNRLGRPAVCYPFIDCRNGSVNIDIQVDLN